MLHDFQTDIDRINGIASVPTILDVVCRTTGMGFAAVARVTEDRWIACSVRDDIAFGLKSGSELKIETTICNEIRDSRRPVVIDHVAADECFRQHPTPALYGFQSYISMPILLPDGRFFGTLCAIDPRPAKVDTPETVGMFRLFAELIAVQIDSAERLQSTEHRLAGVQKNAELREEFIAVLGHDLRNPLAAIDTGARLLQRMNLNERATAISALMVQSVDRMSALIEDGLDFARGRLGGGIAIRRDADEPLLPVLAHVIAELRIGKPDRIIEEEFDLQAPVDCDRRRIAQLLSNLVANALIYGADDQPVKVAARTAGGEFILAVANGGNPIPPAFIDRLFNPFARAAMRSSQQGLGLGLYIAAEVARAHGGTLTVASDPVATVFTFRMPL